MNSKVFDQAMLYMTVYFTNFEFDTFPQSQLAKMKYQVWHDALTHIPEADFQPLIEHYCKTNVYPPSSPTAIIEAYKEVKRSTGMSAEQAWEIVSNHLYLGIRGYSAFVDGKPVYRNRFYDAIKQYPVITSVCKEMESSLADITTDSKSYVRNEFKTIYKRHSEQNLIPYDERLKLGV